MNHTDDQLKTILAKMLPEDVFFTADGIDFNWSNASENCPKERRGCNVLDTELLHLCQLIERNHLTADEHQAFAKLVKVSDTWQQRTRALAQVKGVTL